MKAREIQVADPTNASRRRSRSFQARISKQAQPFSTLQLAAVCRQRKRYGMPTIIEVNSTPTSPRRHVEANETSYPRLRQDAQHHAIALLPLNHFGRRFVVDLQVQILTSDGQIPTVCPAQFLGLEFTGKFVSLER
ncbi:hypothetical protein ABIE85_000904 [Bradyrhizobium diazoefficiens]|jgi:hypothetical protein|uniref:hypothetical protein n=1 Tax=Bradyrhizobium TaxID=374 RepID=UPI00272C850D|nr:hypothetical protein [Bradyrhizobium diazoefficiens]WLA59967.1 hypothetical protein QIH81_15260 [Bradyrhizobium diazoefficiens]